MLANKLLSGSEEPMEIAIAQSAGVDNWIFTSGSNTTNYTGTVDVSDGATGKSIRPLIVFWSRDESTSTPSVTSVTFKENSVAGATISASKILTSAIDVDAGGYYDFFEWYLLEDGVADGTSVYFDITYATGMNTLFVACFSLLDSNIVGDLLLDDGDNTTISQGLTLTTQVDGNILALFYQSNGNVPSTYGNVTSVYADDIESLDYMVIAALGSILNDAGTDLQSGGYFVKDTSEYVNMYNSDARHFHAISF